MYAAPAVAPKVELWLAEVFCGKSTADAAALPPKQALGLKHLHKCKWGFMATLDGPKQDITHAQAHAQGK